MGARCERTLLALLMMTAACSRAGDGASGQGGPPPAAASAPRRVRSSPLEAAPGLRERAVVPEIRARETALAYVPGGEIARAQLVERSGKLGYEFLVEPPDTVAPIVLGVDATTGAVCSLLPDRPCVDHPQ